MCTEASVSVQRYFRKGGKGVDVKGRGLELDQFCQ